MRKNILFAGAVALALMAIRMPSAPAQSVATGANVAGVAVNRSTVNSSATITTGNTFQTVLTSIAGTSTQRQALTIQNNNTTDSCWITFGVLSNGTRITAANATKGNAILLLAGNGYTRYWPYVPNDEIEATCASNSDTLYIDVQ